MGDEKKVPKEAGKKRQKITKKENVRAIDVPIRDTTIKPLVKKPGEHFVKIPNTLPPQINPVHKFERDMAARSICRSKAVDYAHRLEIGPPIKLRKLMSNPPIDTDDKD